MSGPDRPIPLENWVEARRWLLIVEEDIDAAARCLIDATPTN
jgi:hypothetical protein